MTILHQSTRDIAKELYEATHKLSNRKYSLGVHIDTDEVHVHIVWALKILMASVTTSAMTTVLLKENVKSLNKIQSNIPENRISRDMDELDKIKELTLQDKKDIINKKYKDKHPSTRKNA